MMTFVRWVLRILFLGAIALASVYGLAVVYMVSKQDSFIFQTPGYDIPTDAIDQSIVGSTRVSIPTEDGVVLAGWYRPPAPGKVTFLYFHGNVGRLEAATERWRHIFEKGAGLLAFSFRGYPGSPGKPSQVGLFSDGRAAFDWLSKKQEPDTIVLHGLSLGTGVAAKLATEVDAKALVLEAPYTAVTDVAAERFPWLPVHALLGNSFPTRDIIEQVRMPVMIVHGTDDRVIPFAHGKALFERAPEPKVFVKIPNGDHNNLVQDGIYDHVWQFLNSIGG